MTNERIKELLRKGEGLFVEYKRCSSKVENDMFESICAFLNRFGGDALQGDWLRRPAWIGGRNLYKYAKAYGGADPQLTDGDVFRNEVSLKSLQVAQKDAEVAQKAAEVAQKLAGKGRADAINNAVVVFNALQGDGRLEFTHFFDSNVFCLLDFQVGGDGKFYNQVGKNQWRQVSANPLNVYSVPSIREHCSEQTVAEREHSSD